MLFIFELFLFVLVMLTLALGEFVSRGLALTLWLVVTAFAVGGYVLARAAVRPLLDRESGEPERPPGEPPVGAAVEEAASRQPAPADAPDRAQVVLDEKWARTLLYNWRRSNVLLLVGLLAVGGWYWLGR